MECHKCEHREAIQKRRLARVPFEKTPCFKCELKEYSEFTLEYDAKRETASQKPEFSFEEPEDRLPISVMREAMVEFLRLPPEIRDVVCWRFAGMSFKDIAALQGITVAGVEVRLWRAMKKWPALTALFGEKAAKQSRRKNSEHKRE
ncbi:MAG: sigma factor-like helix-turn-helix DNA-binding protein [bacterium]